MLATSPNLDSVDLVDGVLLIHELVETDEDVIRVVGEADDPVEGTRQCMRIGARAIRAVSGTVDTNIVEKRFDAMNGRFEDQLDEAVARIAQAAEALVGEDGGALSCALDAHRESLDGLLGDTFDPDSKRSVIATIEKVVIDAHAIQADAVRKLVSIDDEDGPLARLRRELVRDAGDRAAELRKEFQVLAERIAASEAVAPVLALTTGKGFTYEDAVHEVVGRIASRHGDAADKVGLERGAAGNNKGDEVVTLDLQDTHGLEGRFVLEAKARKLNTRATHAELDAALENREALAAIAVFSTQDEAPTSVPFHYSGNKAIVVLDADGLDDSALQLGYMWARWVVRRELAGSGAGEADFETIAARIDDARRAIDRASAIKRFHTTAKKSIDQAAEQVKSMTSEVQDALSALEDELR